jgi:hypothetical protein
METGCIPWLRRINEHGYGTIGGKLAHRVEWAKVHGPIAEGLTIDHMCHDPEVCQLGDDCPHRRCVNTEHMRLVTLAENNARVVRRKPTRCPKGHPYEGDNLLVCNGFYLCRTCRTEARKKRAARLKAEGCRARGHERDEVIGKAGTAYCRVCIAANCAKGTAARWGK